MTTKRRIYKDLKKATLEIECLFVIFIYGNRKCDAFEWMHI